MKQNKARTSLLVAMCSACIATANGVAAEEAAKKTIAAMEPEERKVLIVEMQRRLDDGVAGKQFFESFPWPLSTIVGLDEARNVITVDLDQRLVDLAASAEGEDLSDCVVDVLWPLMQRIDGVMGIEFLYGGREVEPLRESSPVVSEPSTSERARRSADSRLLAAMCGVAGMTR